MPSSCRWHWQYCLRGHSAKLGLERLHSVLTLHFDVSVELNPSAKQIPWNRQRAIHDEVFSLRLGCDCDKAISAIANPRALCN